MNNEPQRGDIRLERGKKGVEVWEYFRNPFTGEVKDRFIGYVVVVQEYDLPKDRG